MAIGNGFIVISRGITDWQWWGVCSMTQVWLHILMNANWKDGYFMGVKIPRGSFATSVKNLADECGLSESTTRRCLKRLEETGEITKQVTNRFTVINVVKYAFYQDYDGDAGERMNKQMTGQMNKQMTDQMTGQMTPNRTIKQENNITRKQDIYSRAESSDDIAEIIAYLNMRTGSHYKTSTPKTRQLIQTRLKEHFTVQDFKDVIDKKCVEWMGGTMEKYLRPETLFGPKFEGYLNQTDRSPESFFNQVGLELAQRLAEDDDTPF